MNIGNAGLGGVLLTARLGAGIPTAGTGFELNAIAACVIGGASLFGAKGSALGAATGALIMGVLNNGGLALRDLWGNAPAGLARGSGFPAQHPILLALLWWAASSSCSCHWPSTATAGCPPGDPLTRSPPWTDRARRPMSAGEAPTVLYPCSRPPRFA